MAKDKKKAPKPAGSKIELTRGNVIEKIVADMATWEPPTAREWAQAERRNQLMSMSNADLLIEYAELVDENPTDSIAATHEVVGNEDPDNTFEGLLSAIDDECVEHENQVNDADGAVAGVESRGTDFQEALRIAWKLLTPAQRKQAFAEFKETHDFVSPPKGFES